MAEITLDEARRLVNYDPETGSFTAKVDSYRRRRVAGQRVDVLRKKIGYRAVSLSGERVLAHRLAWFMTHGVWPECIDHINGDREDNRIANLRNVTQKTNTENVRAASRNNQAGLLGVSKNGAKWSAFIKVDRKSRYLGTFTSPQLAHEAYLAAKRELHAGCTI